MSWICSNCALTVVNATERCPICRNSRPEEFKLRFDSFEELIFKKVLELNSRQEILAEKLAKKENPMPMTPEEQLFADFFRNEAERIINLSDVELRIRREDLIAVIREGKARLTAVREQERDREAKTRKSQGFARSVDSDEIASDAVNKIKTRAKNMSKMDKVIEGLMKIPGMTRTDAEKIASARNLKEHQEIKANQGINSDELKAKPEISNQPAFNPFQAKTEEPKSESTSIEVTITPEETVIITKTEIEANSSEEKKPFNPFA